MIVIQLVTALSVLQVHVETGANATICPGTVATGVPVLWAELVTGVK